VFARFFRRELEIDLPERIAALIEELGHSGADYGAYAAGDGIAALDACLAEAHADRIFGVPIFVFRDERFWGYDRMPMLEDRLTEHGLRR